ncbi:hypothetical protein [Blastococcus sp. SYSU DS0539]
MSARTGRLIDQILAIAATVTLALYGAKKPAALQAYFDRNTWQLITIIVLAGIIAVVKPFETFAKRGRIARNVQLQRDLLSKLGQLVEKAGRVDSTISMSDPGMHIWKPRRSLRSPISGRLDRVGFYRLGTTPVTLSFTPRKGVGVVGMCWEANAPQQVDVEALASRIATRAEFEAQVATQGKASVMNFTWDEFDRVRHRGAVFAAPIRGRRDKFLGCVSIDVSRGFNGLVAQDVPRLSADVAAMFGPRDLES